MAFNFSDLQSEVARRAVLNQSGSNYTAAIQNAINLSMWRIARDAKWRTLRRKATFNTISTYANGTASGTTITDNYIYDDNGNIVYDDSGNPLIASTSGGNIPWPTNAGPATCTYASNVFSVTGATFISDGIRIGRYIKFDNSVIYFRIASITSETSGTLDQVFDGTSSTSLGYAIMPQEEYVLPIQIGHSAFFWHRKYGMPKVMQYVPAFDFYKAGVLDILTNIPVAYRMWGVDAAIQQPLSASTLTYVSSSVTDNPITVTVFGTVNGLPDYETVTVTGTSAVTGTKQFTYVERVVKNQNTIGVITVSSNPQTNAYYFTVSGITNVPAIGDTYSNNGTTYTLTYINVSGKSGSSTGKFTGTGTGAPSASGILTKVSSATGDTTISFSASTVQNVTISQLPVGMTTTGPQYTKVQVYPLPNYVFPIYVNYYKLPYQLVNATDVPELGEDFSEAIILLSVAKLKAEQNLTQDAANFMNLFNDEIKSLKQTNLDKIDFKAILKLPGEDSNDQYTGGLRFSQIGGTGQYGGSWSP